MAATKRALRLYPYTGLAAGTPEAYDRSVEELSELARLLDHDAELRATVTVQLSSVLTMRHLAGGGVPEDRGRAQRLLREVRDRGTATGAVTDEEDRRWAAFFLLALAMPVPASVPRVGRGAGEAPGFSSLLGWAEQLGPEGMAAAATDIRVLLPEVQELPLPPEVRGQLQQMGTMLSVLAGPDSPVAAMRQVADLAPEGFPGADEMRRMMGMMSGLAGPAAGPEPATPPASDHTGGLADAVALNAVLPSLFSVVEAAQSGDPEVLNGAIEGMRTAYDRMPRGHENTAAIEGLIGALLQLGPLGGGNLQDQSLGRTYTKTLVDQFALIADSGTPLADEIGLMARVYPLFDQVREAAQAEEVTTLRALVTELGALEADTPKDHEFHFLVLLAHGYACRTLGTLTNDDDMQFRGLACIERAAAAEQSAPAFAKQWLSWIFRDSDAVRAVLTDDPTLLKNHTPAPAGASTGDRWSSALSLITRYGLTHDPADLEPVIAELELLRDGVRAGQGPQFAAEALWALAEAYRARWHHSHDMAHVAPALDTAKEALDTLAADVILQQGAEHGLLAARTGAARSVKAATWAASHNQAEMAVGALELGRALVLHAASTARAVPERLEACGHHELAEAWRASGAAQAPADDGPPRELPSTLRRRALEALGYRQQGLFTTPTLNELCDGVAEGEADALVYLLPGEGESPGVAIVVGPDIGVGIGGLSLLSGSESGPLERYLDAAAERSGHLGEPAAEQAWQDALSALCDWAYAAALDTVIPAVAQRLAANDERDTSRSGPPRIVLVPCGRLGVVPWHAARLPEEAPHDYLCQIMVISYAASGSQFLRTVRRGRRDPAAAPVLVADPRQELTHAELEATALYEAYYPLARMCGEFYEPPVEPDAPGTPDEILALLSESPSLLHVASHGSAGVRPTVSSLHLAFPDGSEALPAEEGGPGGDPDSGMLTVTRILDRVGGEQPAADGPLIVLSACETDLSTRDHDEALTLTTAFVSGGARDVVGSRWTTQDGASALMMAVFHHYLAVEGNSPADALRAAQVWMLDPDREDPGSLSGELLREMGRPGLESLPVWAAFIHQGHPGPGRGTAPGKGTV
ncbi:CHAT domain-containing protein [Streptomyces sp. N2-109]|uniref:CHAT domain-containing protein n=2 Tax=Streptomyces gossypii TaxID=2883101 RepID=A0ABT2JUJ7_9ACTN|nr:CHAT domain-containing protein [Streptomyces gossypii]